MNWQDKIYESLTEADDSSTSDARLARENAAKTRSEREAEGEKFDKHGRRIYTKTTKKK